jgi:methionine-rich copper-binding protein CopC
MKTRAIAPVCAAILACGLGTGIASAHANWLHGNLKNHQVFKVGHTPRQFKGFFAENLDPNPSKTWMAVFEGTADHGLVTEGTHSVVNYKNPKEMTLKLPRLAKDSYYLIWYTHSATDGHDAAGILYFHVK